MRLPGSVQIDCLSTVGLDKPERAVHWCDPHWRPNGLELSCPAEAGRLPPLYAWPAGAASTNYRPAGRVSISELIAGPLFGSHARAATLGHNSEMRRSYSSWLPIQNHTTSSPTRMPSAR